MVIRTLYTIVTLAATFIALQNVAQNNYFKHGTLKAQGTLASANFLGMNSTSAYFHGSLEYFTSEKISIRSESYMFLRSYKGTEWVTMNHSNFAGIMYHFKDSSQFDPYVGIQPGLAVSRLNSDQFAQHDLNRGYLSSYSASVNPRLGISVGAAYYAKKFFHLFGHVKYVMGNHTSDRPTINMDELYVSFGLGFQLRVWKGNKEGK